MILILSYFLECVVGSWWCMLSQVQTNVLSPHNSHEDFASSPDPPRCALRLFFFNILVLHVVYVTSFVFQIFFQFSCLLYMLYALVRFWLGARLSCPYQNHVVYKKENAQRKTNIRCPRLYQHCPGNYHQRYRGLNQFSW